MITGADVNRATNLGYTPLLVATQRGRELHFVATVVSDTVHHKYP